MLSYLDWTKQKGFWIRSVWNEDKKIMKGVGKLQLFPIQERILGKALEMDDDGLLKYETILYSCPKKSGKTALSASVGAWYAEEGEPGSEIFCIANDLDSAEGRLMRDIKFHFEQWNLSRPKKEQCKITQYRIDFPNGTFIQALSQSYKSAAGSRHALTLWDELWGYTSELSRRVWDEMVPIPTVTNSMRFISTYAGFENESELLWEMYLRGVGVDEHEQGQGKRIEGIEDLDCWENSRLFTYWTHEPAMPWQTEKYYDEQMASERPSMFMRLHLNQWVTSQESYIPIEWWDAAEKHYEASADRWIDHPFKYLPITIAVDAGVTQDCTAIVAVGYDAKRAKIGLVTHTIWTPEKDQQIDLDQVEKKLLELYNRYQVASIVYDPKHLMQMMYRLKNSGLPVTPFEQTEGNLISGSQLLFELLKNRNVEAYPAPDLRKHVQMAVAKTTQRGFRIVKDKVSKRHHVDGAVALMMACYAAVSGGGVDISQPVVLASPFSDMTVFNRSEEAPFIPPELRS